MMDWSNLLLFTKSAASESPGLTTVAIKGFDLYNQAAIKTPRG
jgi:hypothetical protein